MTITAVIAAELLVRTTIPDLVTALKTHISASFHHLIFHITNILMKDKDGVTGTSVQHRKDDISLFLTNCFFFLKLSEFKINLYCIKINFNCIKKNEKNKKKEITAIQNPSERCRMQIFTLLCPQPTKRA
jgi:hypothetical protein